MTLFPEVAYLERILAETVDINEDGEYTERSTGVYNAVCNRSLRFMADHLGQPDLLDPVRRNLDLMSHLFHEDGTIDTSFSNRQDRGRRIVPVAVADSFFDMGQRDGNGVWARIADLVAAGEDAEHSPWLLQPFLAHPEYRQESAASRARTTSRGTTRPSALRPQPAAGCATSTCARSSSRGPTCAAPLRRRRHGAVAGGVRLERTPAAGIRTPPTAAAGRTVHAARRASGGPCPRICRDPGSHGFDLRCDRRRTRGFRRVRLRRTLRPGHPGGTA